MSDLDDRFRELIREVVRQELPAAIAKAIKPDEPLRTTVAAKLAGVTPKTIRRWIRDGKLTKHHANRELRISRCELEDFMRGERIGDRVRDRDLTPEQLADRDFP